MTGFFSRKNLFLRVAAGFALGILLGLLVPAFSIKTKVVGDIYLNLIKLMIVPVVFCAVFCGITGIKETSLLRKIGLRTLALYVLMFVVSSFIALFIAFLIRPGRGLALANAGTAGATGATVAAGATGAASATGAAGAVGAVGYTGAMADFSVTSFLMQIVPTNIVSSMASGSTIGIILFTLVFAVAVVAIGEKGRPVIVFMNSLSSAFFKMLEYFMELSPIGVLSLMSYSVATYGAGIFSSIARYILCCYISCIAVFFLVMVLPTCLYIGISPKRFLKACGKVSLVTLSTTSSAATLPTTISVSVNDLGAPESISGFTLPLGCTINMCGGACSFACLAVFAAEVYGFSLSFPTILLMVGSATLINMAAPGIPGGGVVLGASFLSLFGLPFDIMGIISGFYRLLDMAFTTINVEGDISANLIISKSVGMYKAPGRK